MCVGLKTKLLFIKICIILQGDIDPDNYMEMRIPLFSQGMNLQALLTINSNDQ